MGSRFLNLIGEMEMFFKSLFVSIWILNSFASGAEANSASTGISLSSICQANLTKFPGPVEPDRIVSLCNQVQVLESCESEKGTPIYHFDSRPLSSPGKDAADEKRVLAIALIHGDEFESGSVARRWMQRLSEISARNHWRIIPIVNPDGWSEGKRTNSNGVDLNRNFPTNDWTKLAMSAWKSGKDLGDPRKFPGNVAGSEKEVKCISKQIEIYRPNFVVSIHTPYGLLDLDGPLEVSLPDFQFLSWKRLGTFPGSLGRYLWVDRKVPVMTVELRDEKILSYFSQIDALQDIGGSLAMKLSDFKNPL
jgi:protein MpaA